jgi:hypothetical protein
MTEAEFKRLMREAIADPVREPAMLRALLEAPLYVHLPLSDDSSRVRLICFTRPDGITVIPVFSDRAKADFAAQGAARVLPLRGRELFAAAPAATFMLDPNDTSMTLYPEEVRALLDDGTVVIAPAAFQGEGIVVTPAMDSDRWLGQLLVEVVSAIPAVQAVHLACGRPSDADSASSFVVMVAVTPNHAERVARAVALALAESPRTPRLGVDLGTYDPAEPPKWTSDPSLQPLWQRAQSTGHHA